jgi:DNA-dependent protein kinase catalytic subunit
LRAGDADTFLAVRRRFAASLAGVSLAGYLAGVGDRHLGNFLIDTHTGDLVAIDFGYSFGTGTQLLPIPELMPFRLTRQMLGTDSLLDSILNSLLNSILNSSWRPAASAPTPLF